MSTWIKADEDNRVLEARAGRVNGWNKVKQTLNGPVLTYDGIPLYIWDGGENVMKRDDQSIERERRERRGTAL